LEIASQRLLVNAFCLDSTFCHFQKVEVTSLVYLASDPLQRKKNQQRKENRKKKRKEKEALTLVY